MKNFNTLGLILSRPVPGFAELITLSAGLSNMPFKNFISVVGITNLGVAIVFSGIGAAAIDSNSSFLAFTGAAVLPALCYFFYKKFYKSIYERKIKKAFKIFLKMRYNLLKIKALILFFLPKSMLNR